MCLPADEYAAWKRGAYDRERAKRFEFARLAQLMHAQLHTEERELPTIWGLMGEEDIGDDEDDTLSPFDAAERNRARLNDAEDAEEAKAAQEIDAELNVGFDDAGG